MQNLGQFLDKHSQNHKDHVAYQIKRGLRTQRFTFEEVNLLSYKTAAFLSRKGLKKGDTVAIWSANMPEYPILYFGCWLLGVVAVPIDIRTTEETVRIFLEKARCKVGFSGKFVPGTFGKLVKESFYLDDLVDLVSDLDLVKNLPKVAFGDLAEIAFTSGTTGTPKGVMLTHGNFLSDVSALCEVFPFKSSWRALSLLPLSHAFEQIVDFLALFKVGITVTYLERVNSLTITRALRKNKITSVALVPQALRLLMNGIVREVERQGRLEQFKQANKIVPHLPIFARRILFSQIHKKLGGSLSFFGCGSAPLDLKLAGEWENLGINIYEGYGATETTAALTINTPSRKKLGSVGRVLLGMEVRVNPETGEIEAYGPNVSSGYFEDPERTKAAFYDGWYRTGDVGEIDREGFLYITGREAFRIVLANGQKVYPEDLEKKLNAHPEVIEACVVGIRRDEGEVVHAAVIAKSPKKVSEIIREVNKNLASHEQILSWSIWKEEDFPRTPILKMDRKKVLAAVSGQIAEEGKSVKVETYDKLVSLIAQVAKVGSDKINEKMTLASDLKIDSLGRVELLSLIEQEMGVAVLESKIDAQTTVADLRRLVSESPPTVEEIPINDFLYSDVVMRMRSLLQNISVFPLHGLFAPIKLMGQENLRDLKLPAIFYFNHIGILDAACVLRALPTKIRERLVMAVNADLWQDYRRAWIEIFGAAFPFDKKEKVKASLELTGEFLDKGFSVLMSPEGTFTDDGRLLEFKQGIGLLAVEMQVPVVPVAIDRSYRAIFPPMEGSFWENLPKRRRKIGVVIGQPLSFAKGTAYEKATLKMKEALAGILLKNR